MCCASDHWLSFVNCVVWSGYSHAIRFLHVFQLAADCLVAGLDETQTFTPLIVGPPQLVILLHLKGTARGLFLSPKVVCVELDTTSLKRRGSLIHTVTATCQGSCEKPLTVYIFKLVGGWNTFS